MANEALFLATTLNDLDGEEESV